MEGKVVSRSTIVSNRQRQSNSNSATLLSRLLDLKKDQALEMPTRDAKHAVAIRYSLNALAKKEKLRIGWDRNTEHTALYLWIDTVQRP